MCGIGGCWRPGWAAGLLERDLSAMAQSMTHRGPDGQGIWIDASNKRGSQNSTQRTSLGLAHRRLAILDVSPAGAQPMATADGRYHLVFNGEVYNHLELRRKLDAPFVSQCDTETLLAAIAVWGIEAALEKAQGMLALACWDSRTRTLTLARDAMGKKPLYYGYLGQTFCFGSELKALAALSCWREHPPEVDRQALGLFLRYGVVPAPWCIWEGLRQLPPGSLLTIQENHIERRTLPNPQAWWSLSEAVQRGIANPYTSVESARDALRPLLQDAVTTRLQADVPVGIFLSGGIDSSLVAALAAQAVKGGGANGQPPLTFTMGSGHASYDETAVAAQTAQLLGSRHHTRIVTERDALACIADLPMVYDEPFADASQLPTMLLARLAGAHATVLLSGDGGDEVFSGYTRYLSGPALWRKLAALPLPLRRAMGRMLEHGGEALAAGLYGWLAPHLPARWRQTVFQDKLHKLGRALVSPTPRDFYHAFLLQWETPPLQGDSLLPTILPDASPDPLAAAAAALPGPGEGAGSMPFAQWMQAMDMHGYLPWDILTKVDRASMAASIEVRCPFLDRRVVEAAWRLPAAGRMAAGRGKVLLRDMLEGIQPMPHLDRPKQGFGIPLEHWLRGPLKPWAEDLLHPRLLAAQGYLDPDAVQQAWREHQSGRRNRQYALWSVLMFQRWLEVWRP